MFGCSLKHNIISEFWNHSGCDGVQWKDTISTVTAALILVQMTGIVYNIHIIIM